MENYSIKIVFFSDINFIILSEFTMKQCENFTFDSIGDILVKGKSEPISIYSVNN